MRRQGWRQGFWRYLTTCEFQPHQLRLCTSRVLRRRAIHVLVIRHPRYQVGADDGLAATRLGATAEASRRCWRARGAPSVAHLRPAAEKLDDASRRRTAAHARYTSERPCRGITGRSLISHGWYTRKEAPNPDPTRVVGDQLRSEGIGHTPHLLERALSGLEMRKRMSEAKAPAVRPLSPHLSIYRPLLSMMMSIVHRITGAALYFGTLLLVWWLLAVAAGPDAYKTFQ